MFYICLELRQSGTSWKYSCNYVDGDRKERKIKCNGCPGLAWIYCPDGQEKKYKEILYSYIRGQLLKQQKHTIDCLINLEVSRLKTS